MLGIDHRHLSQSILLEETGNPLVIRAVVVFSFLLVLIFIGWANIAQVDEVAIATGEIQPAVKLQQVQNFDGGTIIDIMVKDGDKVQKNQVVLRLDTFVLHSELREAQAEHDSLLAQQKRLRALLNGQSPALLNGSKAELLRNAFSAGGHLIEANPIIQDVTNRGKRLQEKKRAIEQELAMKSGLVGKGYIPKINILTLQRDLGEVNAEIAEINEKVVNEYTRTDNELKRIAERINRTEEKLRLADIRAPVAGVIHGLKTHTVGGVIGRGDEIMNIVPADSPLEAVIKIVPRDIGHVYIGQQVKLRFTAYDFSRYGMLYGALKEISATALLDKDGTPYHQGLVKLLADHLGKTPGHNPIIAGMTVQADIVTGDKTILQYLLKPIYASAKQVFRER